MIQINLGTQQTATSVSIVFLIWWKAELLASYINDFGHNFSLIDLYRNNQHSVAVTDISLCSSTM